MNNIIDTSCQLRGEYRAILKGPDGKIKYESGWQPNTILLNGLQYAVQNGIGNRMGLGTSATPATIAQIGLQGSYLGENGTSQIEYHNAVALAGPLYGRYVTAGYIFDAGVATGTINEAVISPWTTQNDFETRGSIRFVLLAPIVKGALDSLTIEHRIYIYQNVGDVSATINVSGVSWDYTIRVFGVTQAAGIGNPNALCKLLRPDGERWDGGENTPPILDPVTSTDWDLDTSLNANMPDITTGALSYGGDTTTYYATTQLHADIDTWNKLYGFAEVEPGVFNKLSVRQWRGGAPTGYDASGLQIAFTRTSDGASFEKYSTHDLKLYVRVSTTRYP